jgi:hypothetical protein
MPTKPASRGGVGGANRGGVGGAGGGVTLDACIESKYLRLAWHVAPWHFLVTLDACIELCSSACGEAADLAHACLQDV